ncbi:NEL-type E3 ubiquitin ligase domain-containing protein [Pseudomonas sp. HMWF021]|uniref:NEL-type E3 ubiquitin ligase domain-containing protein n=1 Tax=Pseudomonas sp. HMWF021 TaxID=2056857 RepID=UPI000D3795C8|nr:NEL-type E3 ubiquitin ligase domain-containing protein [Pseudomonas sp. HMWF021]PTT24489.1 hypothetical protein DBR18_27230 [Pseudomonas sp. HMWF021]
MSNLNGSLLSAGIAPPTENASGRYAQKILANIPQVLKSASPQRLQAIANTTAGAPDWYLDANANDRAYIRELASDSFRLQSQLDETLGALQTDINTFARPLLTEKLKQVTGEDWDVDRVRLRLDSPAPILFFDTGASTVRESSLLDAALHNFEPEETRADAFRSGSGVYMADAERVPRQQAMTTAQFATLCRELDLGARYQRHIKAILKPAAAAAEMALRTQSIDSERAAFKLACTIASRTGNVSLYAFSKLADIREGKSGITMHDRPLLVHRLSLMGFRMTGIVLFSAVAEPSEIKKLVDDLTPEGLKTWREFSARAPATPGNWLEQLKLLGDIFVNGPGAVVKEMQRKDDLYRQSVLTGPIIAYVPGDPDHPVKEYDSLRSFMKELLSQLLSSEYQAFFSRFVAQKDKGHFFTRVNERLKTCTWHQREPLDMGPWWRETAVENPAAEPVAIPFQGELFTTLFEARRDKAITDARRIAVPTGDEDAQARWKRISSALSITWNVFNFAGMLIPGVGEVLLGIMVAQMLEETVEGIEDWSKGDRNEGAAHINSVLINFAQLGLMSSGHLLPTHIPAPVQPSPLFDSLIPVERADGATRLWKPDLSPYAHDIVLARDSTPDAQGLHKHQGKQVLALHNKHFVLDKDPLTGEHRLVHPKRPAAYKPTVRGNGAGAWHTEVERPLTWERRTLLRRLGHEVERFSDDTLTQILNVSGVSEEILRRMHVEGTQPPALLRDAIERFAAYADVGELAQQIIANQVPEALSGYLPGLLTELPRWPEEKAVQLFDDDQLWSRSQKYGNAEATHENTVKLTRAELNAGLLPERALDACSESEILAMLGRDVPRERSARIEAMRDRLAMQAGKRIETLFESLYQSRSRSSDAWVQWLQSEFKGLTTRAAEELVGGASLEEIMRLARRQRIPLRLREQARHALLQIRSSRACEGLYLPELRTVDSARLALHTMENLPGWPDDLRLEVRELSFTGSLHDSVGAANASTRKVLILREDGRYQAFDAQGLELHGADDLYASVLHALPDTARSKLGYDVNQGASLKETVVNKPLELDRVETLLAAMPVRKPYYDPAAAKLRGGMFGFWRNLMREGEHHSAQSRLRELFPSLTPEEISEMLDESSDVGRSMHERVREYEADFARFHDSMRSYLDPRQVMNETSTEARVERLAELAERKRLYQVLRDCWKRTAPRHVYPNGELAGDVLDLSSFRFSRGDGSVPYLRELPDLQGNFDHVTYVNLDNTGFRDANVPFLRAFPGLRVLRAMGNHLTQLPRIIADMPHLNDLVLYQNYLRFTPEDVALLRQSRSLLSLQLHSNPLQLPPDVSLMRQLHLLTLQNTEITSWPQGLFPARFRHFTLDLRLNHLATVPEVAPGSRSAELIARTMISREEDWISPENLQRVDHYAESVGLEPGRPYPPRGVNDSLNWEAGLTREQWIEKRNVWDSVEDEFGSKPFFDIIRNLTRSADYQSSPAYKAELTAKVWRMIDAMAENKQLRDQLFEFAAGQDITCDDSGPRMFNAMGVSVLVHEAYQLISKDLVETALVELARGKSRLDEIGAIARKHIAERIEAGETFVEQDGQGQVGGTIDEVEVHLAFMTDLAQRLDLPWQSRGMKFRRIAGVTQRMIEDAFNRVIALEQGDLLRDSISQQPFWRSHVEGSNRQLFKGFKRRIEALGDLVQAMKRRASGTTLSDIEKARLQTTIEALAEKVGKRKSDVAPGKAISDSDYTAEIERIEAEAQTALKTLTQQAMDRAKLQRTEIPFTVEPQQPV